MIARVSTAARDSFLETGRSLTRKGATGFETEPLRQLGLGERRRRGEQERFEQPLLIGGRGHALCPPLCPPLRSPPGLRR
jgi:hypothetical protein